MFPLPAPPGSSIFRQPFINDHDNISEKFLKNDYTHIKYIKRFIQPQLSDKSPCGKGNTKLLSGTSVSQATRGRFLKLEQKDAHFNILSYHFTMDSFNSLFSLFIS